LRRAFAHIAESELFGTRKARSQARMNAGSGASSKRKKTADQYFLGRSRRNSAATQVNAARDQRRARLLSAWAAIKLCGGRSLIAATNKNLEQL